MPFRKTGQLIDHRQALFANSQGTLATGGSSAPATIKTSLISWWDFDSINSYPDKHGSNNLTNNGSISDRILNGSSQFWSLATNASIELASSSFTIAIAFYLATLSPLGSYSFIFNKDNIGSNGREWTLYFTNVPDPVANRFHFSGYNQSVGTGSITVTATSFGALSANTLYWVVCEYDKVNSQILICVNNGTPDTASTAGITHSNTATPLRIGVSGAGAYYLDGGVRRAAIWNKLLSSEEKDYLWNDGNLRLYREL